MEDDSTVIEASVGLGGVNRPEDVAAIRDRLVELGFTFVPGGTRAGPELVEAIELFQAIKSGDHKVGEEGVDGRCRRPPGG